MTIRCRSDVDNSKRKNHVSPELHFPASGDDVTSCAKRSGICRAKVYAAAGLTQLSDTAFLPRQLPQSTVTDLRAAKKDHSLVAPSVPTTANSLNSHLAMTQGKKHGYRGTSVTPDHATQDASNAVNSNILTLEATADSSDSFRSIQSNRLLHANAAADCNISSSTSFIEEASTSCLDAAMSSFMRSDLDVQSSSSSSTLSLYEVLTRSPGCRRRRQQRRRQQLGHNTGQSTGRRRHSRQVHDKQVSSSFENLVGGLLSVPSRRLANATENLAVSDSVLTESRRERSSDRLCGRGADMPPALLAFVASSGSATSPCSRWSPLPSQQTIEPILPRRVKQSAHQGGRAKHLFKACRSCLDSPDT